MKREILRGDIYFADLDPVVGSEQGGIRPVLVIQNDIGNKYSPTIIVASLSTQVKKLHLPTHVLAHRRVGLQETSMVMTEQVHTIDKRRLQGFVGVADQWLMNKVETALGVSFGLNVIPTPVTEPEPQEEQASRRPYVPETLPGFENEKPDPPPVVMELCLCPQCAQQYYDSPEHSIRRIDPLQVEKDYCTYCQVRRGFDFRIIRRRKRLGDDDA